MRLTETAQQSMASVTRQFETGDLSPVVRLATIQRSEPVPFDRWTFSNQIVAYIQTNGSTDVRGYRQWQEAGRQVRKGSKAAYILGPLTVKAEDPKTGEETLRLVGFKAIPVFPLEATEGDPLDNDPTPRDPPPLADVAAALGIPVSYQAKAAFQRYAGSYNLASGEIRLLSHDLEVFFHELAHAIHHRIDPDVQPGAEAETTAELTAAILMHLYGYGDITGNCWQYIQHYNPDPLTAIYQAMTTVGQIIETIQAATQPIPDCA